MKMALFFCVEVRLFSASVNLHGDRLGDPVAKDHLIIVNSFFLKWKYLGRQTWELGL